MSIADVIDPSTELCLAIAQLEVLIDRWEDQAEHLLRLFGGVEHTDVNVLHSIQRTVQRAKDAIDHPTEQPDGGGAE